MLSIINEEKSQLEPIGHLSYCVSFLNYVESLVEHKILVGEIQLVENLGA